MTLDDLAPDSGIGHSLHVDAGPSWCDDQSDELDRDADALAMLDGFDDADDEFAFWFAWIND